MWPRWHRKLKSINLENIFLARLYVLKVWFQLSIFYILTTISPCRLYSMAFPDEFNLWFRGIIFPEIEYIGQCCPFPWVSLQQVAKVSSRQLMAVSEPVLFSPKLSVYLTIVQLSLSPVSEQVLFTLNFQYILKISGILYPHNSSYNFHFYMSVNRFSSPSHFLFILQLALLHVSEQVLFPLRLSIHPPTFSARRFSYSLPSDLKVSTRRVNSSPFFNTSTFTFPSHFHFSLPLSISPTLLFIRYYRWWVDDGFELAHLWGLQSCSLVTCKGVK